MSQIAYGTITITDTNDIERIYTVYAKSTTNTTAPSAAASSWTESISTAPGSGDYIWQRTVVEKSGTGELTYSDPVCVTGPEGDPGATGKGVKSLVTQYYLSTSSSSVAGGSWSATPQSYPTTGTKYYWTKTITTYTDNTTYESTAVYDVALTSSVKDARDANVTADEAKGIAQQTSIDVTNLQTRTKYFWTNLTAHTNGTSGWTKPDYPAGTFAASGINGTTFNYENSSTYGYNTLYSNGIKLRYNAINLGELTGSSLIFYNPSTSSQGTKAMELSGSSLKFYASNGTTAQAEFGGTQARVSGTINAYDGQIGNSSSNYWYIGNYTDYNQNQSAAIRSYGTAFIQLGDSNTWRLATNRFHSAWNDDSSGTSGQLHYPVYDSKYWDSGLHLPTSTSDKFLYIRNAPNTQALENLQNDLEDSGYDYWTYQFYVDGEGNLHAGDIYSHGTLISGTSAPYLLKSGGTITGNLEVNGTLTKGSKNVAYLTATPTNGQILIADGTAGGIKTSGYTIATSVPSGALFTDKNVQTSQANTTKIYLAGTPTTGTATGTLNYDSNVYLTTTAGMLHATTFDGTTFTGTAAKATNDSDGNKISTTYLKLSGGTVSGEVEFGSAVSVNDEFYADSITAGNLIVNGAGRFTNGLYGDLTGNVTGNVTGNASTADKVNHNLVIKLASGTTEGTNMFTFNGSAAKTVDITKSALGLGNVENKSSATIRGELTSANVTTALGFTPYDSTNPNGYTSNVGTITGVTAGTGLNGGGTSGAVTLNHSNSVTAQTTQGIYPIKIDAQGHISAYGSAPTTLSGYGITDAKIANGVITLGSNTITPLISQWTANLYVGKTATDKANAAATNGNVYLNLVENNTVRNAHKITGDGTVSVTSDANGNITVTGSAHPTSLKNPNALAIKVYSGTSTSSNINYDGSVANQSVSVAGSNAITGIKAETASGTTTFTLTTAAGAESTFDVNVTGAVVTGATALTDSSGNPINEGGATTAPVYFSSGLPVAITSIPYSLLSNTPSIPTVSGTSGYLAKFNGANSVTNGPALGTDTTKFLNNKGEWAVPGGTYSLPLAANGTRGGVQIGFTTNAVNRNYAVQLSSEKMYVNVPWTDTTYSAGTGLSLTGTTFANTGVTGVKGNSENSYRTGQVNLTPANLGAVKGNSYLFYGTCNTEAATAEKAVTCADFTSNDLQPGAIINVYFTVTNSAAVANLQLNVNGTGAKSIKYIYNGSYNNIPVASYIKLNQVYQFTYDGTYWIVQMIYNTDADWRVRADYGRFTAGTTGLLAYALVMQTSSGRWESITTTSTTATTKVKNTAGFLLGAIYYKNTSTSVAEGDIDSSWQMSSSTLCDARYHFNIENTTALKLNNGNALYLVGTIENDGLFYLADTWWAQSLPTAADGKYYIYIGTVFDWYRYNLDVFHPIYKFVDGKVRSISLDAILVNNHTVNSDVPSNAKFTDTWNALSTSQAGYVTKAPNDTGKFLRGDATWAAVTKANVGLSNVENTALSTWTGSSNITTVGTISTGTWNGSTIAVNKGGTGATTFTAGAALIGNGTNAIQTRSITNITSGAVTASTNLVTANSLVAHVSNALGNYVTIAGDSETVTGTKTFTNLLGTKYVATKGGVGCEINYNASLEALVFSFA